MFSLFKKKEKPIVPDNTTETAKEEIPKKKMTSFEEDVYDADHGNYYIATHVGISYHYGIEKGSKEHPMGLEPNLMLAEKYLTLAAERGFLRAQVDLGILYYDSESELFDKEAGFKWLSLAAKKGDPFSQYVLAFHYNEGEYLPKDEYKAYHWFLESASNGYVGAMSQLASIYHKKASALLNKEGFSEEDKKESWENAKLSFKWYKKAADSDDAEAMFYVGVYYNAGFGVEKNDAESIKYIDSAIANGVEYAQDFKNKHLS